jgi:uncharacterized protein YkwD
MRKGITLLAAGGLLLAGQTALTSPALADSQITSVTRKAAMKKGHVKKGRPGKVVSRLRVVVDGAPAARITVKGPSTRRTLTDSATLRVPVGSYRLRAGRVQVGGDDYSPRRHTWRVQVKRGSTTIVTAEYARSGASGGGSVDPQAGPSGDMAVLFDLVNQARATTQKCGARTMPAVDPVAWDDDLAEAARLHAEDMAAKDYFEHDSLDGRSFVDRIEATAYDGYAGGENIAMGFQSPKDVLQGWLNSPGHCTNMMDPDFADMGLGFASRTDAGYTLATTYWVQDFGYGA